MPLSLANVVGNVAHLIIDFGEGQTLNLTFLPSMITDKTLALLTMGSSLQSANGDTAVALITTVLADMNQSIVDTVKDWDFYEDEQHTVKVPITMDRLSSLPLYVRMRIIRAVVGAAQVGEANGDASSTALPDTSPSATPIG